VFESIVVARTLSHYRLPRHTGPPL
jgi:hypothetical protein